MDDIEKKIEEIVKRLFDANYYSGNPRVPPHTHNGIDNLPIAGSGGGGKPAGTDGAIQFNDTGSFGGDSSPSLYLFYNKTTFTLGVPNIVNNDPLSPTGIDGNNQQFTISQTSTGNNLPFKIFTTDADPTNIGSDSDSLNITTGNAEAGVGKSGSILLQTGDGKTGGDINITTGTLTNANQGNINVTANNNFEVTANNNAQIFGSVGASLGSDFTNVYGNSGVIVESRDSSVTIKTDDNFVGSSGDIIVQTGLPNSSSTGGHINIITQSNNSFDTAGDILIGANNSRPSVSYADVLLTANGGFGTATVRARQYIVLAPNTINNQSGTAGVIHLIRTGSVTGGNPGSGVIFIGNTDQAPTGTPSAGGILYTESGALKFKGSGGTVTTIAPA